ncbi:C-type mannose receptor 2-like [Glandiceps talaboti]
MKSLVVILSTVLFTTVSAYAGHGGCESEWEYFQGKCYYAYEFQKYTYGESKTICEGKGGSLVTIDNAEENLFLYGFSRDANTLWIGATDSNSEGTWQWQDGSEISYSNWASNEPNDAGGKEDCAHLRGAGDWNDHECQSKRGLICEKYPDTGCEPGWECFDGHCYLVSKEPTHSYEEARAVCASSDSLLVIINNAREDSFIKGFSLNKFDIWIGLNDLKEEGKWKWEDGSQVTYSNWIPTEPNSLGNEDCAQIRKEHDDKWNDIDCSNKYGYICEKE